MHDYPFPDMHTESHTIHDKFEAEKTKPIMQSHEKREKSLPFQLMFTTLGLCKVAHDSFSPRSTSCLPGSGDRAVFFFSVGLNKLAG
jgi:hypothetical protein